MAGDNELAAFNMRGTHQVFKFDKVFREGTTQEDIYADTQPLVRSVLDGACAARAKCVRCSILRAAVWAVSVGGVWWGGEEGREGSKYQSKDKRQKDLSAGLGASWFERYVRPPSPSPLLLTPPRPASLDPPQPRRLQRVHLCVWADRLRCVVVAASL